VAQQSILWAQAHGAPEANIDLVRDFITAAEGLLKRTQNPNPAIPAGVFANVSAPTPTPGTVGPGAGPMAASPAAPQ
jgi:hypothetical protein